MTVLVLLWVVCAGVAGWIASTKDRDVGGFAIAGLLLGPAGVVWAACARTGLQRAADDQAALDRAHTEAARRERGQRPSRRGPPLHWPDDTE
jgi:hypothetical protein